jgi:beta-lactamase regulating signal transducer with metallopeptidase domain/Tol biopolymer transport system component
MSIDSFNDWSTAATVLTVAIIWQSAVLASLVAGVCWLLRHSAPTLRYWCWQIVALKLLLMPWWIVTITLPGLSSTDTAKGLSVPAKASANGPGMLEPAVEGLAVPSGGKAKLFTVESAGGLGIISQLSWRSWLVLAWVGGIAWQLGCLFVQRGRLKRLMRRATPVTESHLLSVIQQVIAQLGISPCPSCVLIKGAGSPFVYGLWRPVLVLPRELMTELDPEQWRDILLHELGHLKRHDLWWGWLPTLARFVYFFHPLVHWVCFRIRLERELACDQLAMRLGGRSPAEYARILVQVVSLTCVPSALTGSSLQGLSTFWKRRLTMLRCTSRSSPQLSLRTGLALISAALLACLLPTFVHAPAEAQPPKTQPSAQTRGRIYVSAGLRYKAEGQDEEKTYYMIIAIDPATGKWQKITDRGYFGRVSPDRQTLVFTRLTDAGIWNCDTGGTNNPGKISDKSGRPIWSADGKHLVATKQEDVDKDNDKNRTTPAWKDETWRMDADGHNPVKLPIPDTDSVEDWSLDGQWFVTCSDRHPPYGSGYQLYVMKTDGTQQRRLTKSGLNVYARFSPDGKKILFTRQTAKEGNSIWTMDTDGKNAREIVKEENLASPDGAFWSPDGKQIAVIMFNWELDGNGRPIHRAGSDVADYRILIMDADGTNRRRLQLREATFKFISSLGDWR